MSESLPSEAGNPKPSAEFEGTPAAQAAVDDGAQAAVSDGVQTSSPAGTPSTDAQSAASTPASADSSGTTGGALSVPLGGESLGPYWVLTAVVALVFVTIWVINWTQLMMPSRATFRPVITQTQPGVPIEIEIGGSASPQATPDGR